MLTFEMRINENLNNVNLQSKIVTWILKYRKCFSFVLKFQRNINQELSGLNKNKKYAVCNHLIHLPTEALLRSGGGGETQGSVINTCLVPFSELFSVWVTFLLLLMFVR